MAFFKSNICKIKYKKLLKEIGADPHDVSYRYNLSQKHRYLYVETPKVACTTIKAFLQAAEGRDISDQNFEEVHDRDKSPLLKPDKRPDLLFDLLGSDNSFKFTFVRNPYTRILSAYLDKIKRTSVEQAIAYGAARLKQLDQPVAGDLPLAPDAKALEGHRRERLHSLSLSTDSDVSFKEFVESLTRTDPAKMDAHWRPQTLLTAQAYIDYDFIGRFERLEADLNWVANKLNIMHYLKIQPTPHRTNSDRKISEYYTDYLYKVVANIYIDDFKAFDYKII
jgi:hypothetical protein